VLARDLHNSIKGFIQTIDPALQELVEEKLSDSGNRLEHILQLTENAATTTLDHVEAMQKRNEEDHENLEKLRSILLGLKALGETAQEQLAQGKMFLDSLRVSSDLTRDDLITILTAQDYQDLTGQIILKIIKLINDLQLKMVNLIRTFGVGTEERKKSEPSEELYGTAHQGKIEALHSQDDVDQLLAEFGF
jgi:chemotaxis protein CheZ